MSKKFINQTALDYRMTYDEVFPIWYRNISLNQKYDFYAFYKELEDYIKKR